MFALGEHSWYNPATQPHGGLAMTFLYDLAKAMPALGQHLSTIDWQKYSPHYQEKNFHDLILEYRPPGESRGIPLSWGDIRDKWKSLPVLDAKFGVLTANPTFRSSLEGRNPEMKIYGGAIRLNDGGLLGATRKPELGDDIIVHAIARYMGMIDQDTWHYRVDPFHPAVHQARNDKDMSQDAYMAMVVDVVRCIKLSIPGAI